MFKKTLALILGIVLVASAGFPAYAFQKDGTETVYTETRRPMEEILNRYHLKNLALDSTAGNSSRSIQTNKALKQDTIKELRSAGYEAYDVNSSTYEALEDQLNTDFSEIGLNTDSSYIIVISGDSSSGNSARIVPGVDATTPDFGDSGFLYTYMGTTYIMRFVTVTATDNHALGQSSIVNLSQEMDSASILEVLEAPISVVTLVDDPFYLGTLFTLLDFFPEVVPTQYDAIDYRGSSNWTITYTQIYNTTDNKWTFHSSTEYVTMQYSIVYTSYSPTLNRYTSHYESGVYGYIYSDNYYDIEVQKETAVVAYNSNTRWQYEVEVVSYMFDETNVLTHQRFTEPLGYEP